VLCEMRLSVVFLAAFVVVVWDISQNNGGYIRAFAAFIRTNFL